MKKLFSILLVVLMSFSLVACGGGNSSNSSKSKDKSVEEVKQIMLDKGYNVTDSDEGDLFFEEGLVAVKGIDFDHDDELLLFTYYEFPSTKDIEKLRTDCNGDAFEKINDNFYAYTDFFLYPNKTPNIIVIKIDKYSKLPVWRANPPNAI